MWSDLPIQWQTCFELAWESYCTDCFPIGAVVISSDGRVVSRGRNRIYEKVKPGAGVNGAALAHAEMEALLALDFDAIDPHTCTLVTSTEPCPLCMGAFYMSGIRTLHFASRDPYAGSTNLLGTTWYLSRKQIKVTGPHPQLEPLLVALFAEQDLHFHNWRFPSGIFWEMYAQAIPEGIALAQALARSRTLVAMRNSGSLAQEVFDRLLLLL